MAKYACHIKRTCLYHVDISSMYNVQHLLLTSKGKNSTLNLVIINIDIIQIQCSGGDVLKCVIVIF
jgi:hypothetical protein